MSDKNILPTGWIDAKVGDVIKVRNGCAFKSTDYCDAGIPVVRQAELKGRTVDLSAAKYLPESFVDDFEAFIVKKGDLLIGMSGSLGKVARYESETIALQNQRTGLLVLTSAINERFAGMIMRRLETAIIQKGKGIAVQNVSSKEIENEGFSLPPLAEQIRIASRFDELESDLDAGVAALKRAKANLKRYRASVLKAAVEGKLTEEWRAKHPAKEPASALLVRILKERRQKWEADQLAKFAAAEKEPPKNWRDKYVEPSPPDTKGLPELPEGWCWTSLDSLCSVIADIDHNMPKSDQTGVKFLSAKDLLDDGTLNFTNNIKLISEADYVRLSRKVKPQRNDIIYSRIGARLGKSRLVETDERFLVSYSCCTIRPIVIVPKFLARYLDCEFVLRRAISDAQSIGVPDLGLEKIKAFAVPLCSIKEQNEIVAEMEQKLSVISVAEKEIAQSLLRASRLRQSILKQAFDGKLVPQDPKDEPASVLLERLRASRSHDVANGTAATTSRSRKRSTKSKQRQGGPTNE